MLKCGCSPKLLTGDTSSVCALGKAKDCLNQVLGSIGAGDEIVFLYIGLSMSLPLTRPVLCGLKRRDGEAMPAGVRG